MFADNQNAWPGVNSNEKQLFKYQENNLGLKNKFQWLKGLTGPIDHPDFDMRWMEVKKWNIPAKRALLWETGDYFILLIHTLLLINVRIY